MMRLLHEQLREAFSRTGWSVAELLRRTGFDIDRSSLSRKLDGSLPMKTSEAERLAEVLTITLAFIPTSTPTAGTAA